MALTRTCDILISQNGLDLLREAHLDGVLVGEQVDDLESVRNNADSKELLSVVASLHHQAKKPLTSVPICFEL